jgi:hypothetical protein
LPKEKEKFILKYGDRNFDLKANSEKDKKLWIKCIKLLKDYNLMMNRTASK